MHTATADDLFGWQRNVTLGGGADDGEPLHGLCGWFDVAFCGRRRRAGGRVHVARHVAARRRGRTGGRRRCS